MHVKLVREIGSKKHRNGCWSSTEFPTDSYQDPKPTKSKHSGNDCFDPKREIVPDGYVEPLVVEKDGEGREETEEVHYRHHLFGQFWVTVDDVRESTGALSLRDRGERVRNLRDGGHHLGTVRRETTRDGKVCPVDVVFSSDAKPQKADLKDAGE